jgi:hypothetical protein
VNEWPQTLKPADLDPAQERLRDWLSEKAAQSGADAPQDEDADENPARAPLDDADRARDLENPVPPEENSGGEADELGREPEPAFFGGSPMPSAAAEMFTRSRYARMYKKNSHGISRG